MAKSSWFWKHPSFTNIVTTVVSSCDTDTLQKLTELLHYDKTVLSGVPGHYPGDVECSEK